MNKLLLLPLLTGCLFLMHCDSATVNKKDVPISQPATSPTLKRVLLVVDGSSSLNEQACENITQKVLDVFDALGEMHEIRVFLTTEGTRTPPVFEWKKVSPTRPSEEEKYLTQVVPTKKEELRQSIQNACRNGSEGSYIIHGIQSAYSNVQGASVADHTLLLILSDMLECSPNYYGCSEGRNGFNKMTPELEQSPLRAECPLSKVIPLENVAMCVISMNNEQRYISLSSSPECRAFWNEVFIKMGYSNGPEPATDIGKFLDNIRS